ncbi:MAG TPA: hypothetical protein VEC96_09910 [Anaerolineae bacterium]|nr:hypothetical protein [Anaerolineae bacterium]HXW00165.1 hypothetical protein [Anaerolineae bacterium]
MRIKFWLIPLITPFLLFATACGGSAPVAQPPPAAPTNLPAVDAATHTPAIEPTQAAAAATTPPETMAEPATAAAPATEGVDWLTVEGKTADNLAYLGNPDAPVTIIDYSDFL